MRFRTCPSGIKLELGIFAMSIFVLLAHVDDLQIVALIDALFEFSGGDFFHDFVRRTTCGSGWLNFQI